MQLFEIDPFIPVHKSGKQLDLEYSVTEQSVESACLLFNTACRRLLQPFVWHQLAGDATAVFTIYEKEHDHAIPVDINDHLFIDLLPTEGHDWVIVEDIQQKVTRQADESMGITLRASNDPRKPEDTTSHFFTASATSTLIIKRTRNVVSAAYHGRNEEPNTESGSIPENIRNVVVAAGAMLGLSKLQWNSLLKGLLSA